MVLNGDLDNVLLEKKMTIENISDHFLTPLKASIILQGQKTDNRWQE